MNSPHKHGHIQLLTGNAVLSVTFFSISLLVCFDLSSRWAARFMCERRARVCVWRNVTPSSTRSVRVRHETAKTYSTIAAPVTLCASFYHNDAAASQEQTLTETCPALFQGWSWGQVWENVRHDSFISRIVWLSSQSIQKQSPLKYQELDCCDSPVEYQNFPPNLTSWKNSREAWPPEEYQSSQMWCSQTVG